ncbi:MAG: outer membrane lipoprotein-sorting protein [Gammaproteobacteria bacterium]|nr:outer membrane lipoprotein-sorting protein [Gammaproteobacteria bacterium]
MSVFALTADEIAQKVEDRDDGDNVVSTITMTLIDKNNNQRVRSMKKYAKDKGDDTQSVIFFLKPSDVKDTAFLTYDFADSDKDDDQWLYLPALRKTKRIVSSDKSGSFMGSDFSYADMTQRDIKDYSYKIAKESKVGDVDVWIMESKPKSQKTIDETGYNKSYMFVRKDNFVVTRAIHFLTDGKKKYLDVKKLEEIDGVWVSTLVEMKTTKNKNTLHKTILKTEGVKYNQDIKESFFSVRRIEKGL